MRILIVTQYFWPESFVINDFALLLAKKGHEICVATGKPNYPDGEIYAGYKSRGVDFERYADAIDIYRAPVRPRGGGGAKNLLLNYLSFVLMGTWHFPKLLTGREFDLILVFAPSPITQIFPAILLKYIKRAHLAVWVQDLWPESLSATGFIRNKFLLSCVGCAVKVMYKSCDTLLLQSRAFFDPSTKYASSEKMVYFPNSINPDAIITDISPELEVQIKSGFSVVFAGNIGTVQSIESIVAAAEILASESDIKIFIIGSGSMSHWASEQKKIRSLTNLILPGRFPMSAMPRIFSAASALLVTLKDQEIFSYTVPSKVQAYLAANRPIIAALRGEGARVVVEAGAGLVCPPDNPKELASAILVLKNTSVKNRAAMGASGVRYFESNYDMSAQSDNFINIICARMDRGM